MKKTGAKKRNYSIKTSQICGMSILCALAVVFACFARGMWPSAPFLEYTPADVPVLMGSFMYGPLAGVIMAAIVAVIQGVSVSASSGIIGIAMNFISTAAFVLVGGLIYKKMRTLKGAIIAVICSAISGVIVMMLWNMILTPIFMKVERQMVIAMIPTVFLPFNLVKYFSNAAITFILYKATHKLLNFAFRKVPDIKLGKIRLSGEYNVTDIEGTNDLAEKIANTLSGGEIILLSGDLGAGKTTFTKALAKALDVEEEITSPTFTILNVYESGRLKLNHLDMYRIESEDELTELGLEECISQDGVTVIEWNKLTCLTGRIIDVKINYTGETSRCFVVSDSQDEKTPEKKKKKVEEPI